MDKKTATLEQLLELQKTASDLDAKLGMLQEEMHKFNLPDFKELRRIKLCKTCIDDPKMDDPGYRDWCKKRGHTSVWFVEELS